MKKPLCWIVLSLLLTLPGRADVVTPSRALQIAGEFLGEDLAPQRVRGMRGVAPADGQENAPLYVISRGDDRGFVLVSGDDSQPGIIGYTDHGNFDENDLPPALEDLMDRVAEAVRAAQKGHLPAREPKKVRADWHTIDPLITSHWNQGAPWNGLCPICTDNGAQSVAGCVAIAAAQIIYYFRKDLPHELQNTTPTYKSPYSSNGCDVTVSYPKGTPLEYDLMLDTYGGGEPAECRDAVALLCYTVGACSNMNYWHSSATGISSAGSAMTNYFGLSGTYMYREESFPDDQWLSIAYSSLSEGSPLLYSGYRKRDNSAHAYIYDGFDSSNGLWHINFGWGGNYDGYYTIDYETAGDGFGEQQQLIHHIRPHHLNLSAEIVETDTLLYRRINNTVAVEVTNNGTVPMTGYRAYLLVSDKAPTSSSTATSVNEETFVAPGETVPVAFEIRPTLTRDYYYLYVTDRNGDVLAHRKVALADAAPQLAFQGLTASVSTETVETAQGTFQKLNNDAITLCAEVSNAATAATPGAPDLTFTLTRWDAGQGAQVLLQSTTVDGTTLLPGERKTIECSFADLSVDALLTATVTATGCEMTSADTTLFFVVGGRTLTLSEPMEGLVTVTGGWDSSLFAQLANDPSVTAYDLTGVTGLQAPLTAANPNALFYVSTPISASNVIVDGECADLVLTSGYDFRPVAPFHAAKAAFVPDFVAAVWNTLTLPFACERPAGWLCREVTEMSSSAFTAATLTDQLEPSHAYVVMSDSRSALPFAATDVAVTTAVDTTRMTPFIGTYHAVLASPLMHEGDKYILSLDTDPTATTPYFEKTDTTYVLPPFQTVISSTAKKIRATVNTKVDPACRKLAAAIDVAKALYDEMHTGIADSTNQAMESLLAEARTVFYAMNEETSDRLTALTKQLTALSDIYPLSLKEITRPVDYTLYLTNPSFEANSKNGWKGDAYSAVKSTTQLSFLTFHGDGKYMLYNNKSGASSAISQTVSGLPAGYYRATALLNTAVGGTVTFYANDQETTVMTTYADRYYLTEAVIDSICVKDGNLTVGVRAGETWYKADNFRIYYIGHLSDDDTSVGDLLPGDPQPALRDDAIYDLPGRRLPSSAAMQPGRIYIRNGRKIMKE